MMQSSFVMLSKQASRLQHALLPPAQRSTQHPRCPISSSRRGIASFWSAWTTVPPARAALCTAADQQRQPQIHGGPGGLRLHPTPEAAEIRLRAFLRRRHWLRRSPEAPLQLVQVPANSCSQPAASQSPEEDGNTSTAAGGRGGSSSSSSRNSVVGSASTTTGSSRSRTSSSSRAPSGGGGGGSTRPASCSPGAATSPSSFYIVRDDLLHPVLGGNKVRKLDGLVPELLAEGTTDLVTCGGLQSAHLAAVAVVAAERGLRSHLMVRGEQPQVPTGYHLVTRMYGSDVSYISRSEYADRDAMLSSRAAAIREAGRSRGGAKVAVLSEGGGDPPALLGLIRLAHWLAYGTTEGGPDYDTWVSDAVDASDDSDSPSVGGGGGSGSSAGDHRAAARVCAVRQLPYATSTPYKFIVDSGTGTTAIGLALGIALLGLPWTVHAVILAGDLSYYRSQQEHLVRTFLDKYGTELFPDKYGKELFPPGREPEPPLSLGAATPPRREDLGGPPGNCDGAMAVTAAAHAEGPAAGGGGSWAADLPLRWLPRPTPRRFGKVLEGEIETCRAVAQSYGIGLDPIYSLAAWEVASREAAGDDDPWVAAPDATSASGPGQPHRGPGTAEGETTSGGEEGGGGGDGACGGGGGGGGGGGIGERGKLTDPRVAPVDRPTGHDRPRVVMLHGGGFLGLHGLAQRYPAAF